MRQSLHISSPLDLARSFGQLVDVAVAVQNPDIVEAQRDKKATKSAIFRLFLELFRVLTIAQSVAQDKYHYPSRPPFNKGNEKTPGQASRGTQNTKASNNESNRSSKSYFEVVPV